MLTIVTSPIDVDTSAIVAGKLSQGEASGISCEGRSVVEWEQQMITGSLPCFPSGEEHYSPSTLSPRVP